MKANEMKSNNLFKIIKPKRRSDKKAKINQTLKNNY